MLIDSHCHLHDEKYEKTVEQLLDEASKAGVSRFINIGTSIKENLMGIEIADKFENVYQTVAIYPHAEQEKPLLQIQNELSGQLMLSKKVVGIGECGIDIAGQSNERNLKDQIELLEMQLQLAIENRVPVVIHNRGGDAVLFDILDEFVPLGLRGVAHCFSQSQEIADNYLERGFYVSFSGMLTYPSRADLRDTAKNIPIDKVMFETDAPYLPPQGFRGQINEPKHVVEVAKTFSEVTLLPFDKVCDIAYSNTCKLFGIPM